MRLKTAVILLATLMCAACDDDPIIGHTDSDTGGGSYGVIHFNTSPTAPGNQAPETETATVKKDNPKRF